MEKRNILNKARGLVIPAVIFAIWWAITSNRWVSPIFLPPPEKVYVTFLKLISEGKIYENLGLSLLKVAEGFFIGVAAGLFLGTLMAISKTAEKLLNPLFNAVRQVPVLGWIPILILLFGLTELAKVIFIAMGAFYPMTLNTFDGCRQLKNEYLEVAKVFEYGRFRLFRRFILPSAMPSILAGIRVSMSEAWLLVIGAEIFFKARGGIGDMLWDAKEKLRMDVVFITILIIGLIGYILNQVLSLLESRLLRWRDSN
jgi:sulfonate transport system permease protein